MIFWLFHRHFFHDVAREWMERGWFNRQTGECTPDGTPITVITQLCIYQSCGKYRQQTLRGHLPGGSFHNYPVPEEGADIEVQV